MILEVRFNSIYQDYKPPFSSLCYFCNRMYHWYWKILEFVYNFYFPINVSIFMYTSFNRDNLDQFVYYANVHWPFNWMSLVKIDVPTNLNLSSLVFHNLTYRTEKTWQYNDSSTVRNLKQLHTKIFDLVLYRRASPKYFARNNMCARVHRACNHIRTRLV